MRALFLQKLKLFTKKTHFSIEVVPLCLKATHILLFFRKSQLNVEKLMID